MSVYTLGNVAFPLGVRLYRYSVAWLSRQDVEVAGANAVAWTSD